MLHSLYCLMKINKSNGKPLRRGDPSSPGQKLAAGPRPPQLLSQPSHPRIRAQAHRHSRGLRRSRILQTSHAGNQSVCLPGSLLPPLPLNHLPSIHRLNARPTSYQALRKVGLAPIENRRSFQSPDEGLWVHARLQEYDRGGLKRQYKDLDKP